MKGCIQKRLKWCAILHLPRKLKKKKEGSRVAKIDQKMFLAIVLFSIVALPFIFLGLQYHSLQQNLAIARTSGLKVVISP